MANSFLEHVNATVSDTKKTADMLCDVFGWHIRWEGDSIHGGHTVHVGTDTSYVALYNPPAITAKDYANYYTVGGLNHLGIVVDNLERVEAKVDARGFKTHSHADYEPGRRFYFHDEDGVEYEVICYV